MADTKTFLEEKDIPKAWYNIAPDLPVPQSPPLHPGTKQPLGPDGPGATLPHGPHWPGGEPGAIYRDTGGGAGGVQAVASHAAQTG